jgi:hypothetical protein
VEERIFSMKTRGSTPRSPFAHGCYLATGNKYNRALKHTHRGNTYSTPKVANCRQIWLPTLQAVYAILLASFTAGWHHHRQVLLTNVFLLPGVGN